MKRYTALDSGKDRAIDVRGGDDDPFLRVTCKTMSATTGIFAELEQPVGTPFGTVRVGGRRLGFELANGGRVGEAWRTPNRRGRT